MSRICNVPKDLSNIKTKLALGLTRRQLFCFGTAALVGLPFYFFAKPVIGIQAATMIMVGLVLPFFFIGMYEKDGFPAEKILFHVIRQKILFPGIRPYRSDNTYRKIEKENRLRKEVAELEEKSQKRKKVTELEKLLPEERDN